MDPTTVPLRRRGEPLDATVWVKVLMFVGIGVGVALVVLGIVIVTHGRVEVGCAEADPAIECYDYPYALEGAVVALTALMLMVLVALVGTLTILALRRLPAASTPRRRRHLM